MKFTNYYYKAFMLTSLQIPLLFSWHLKKKFPCQAQTDNCTTNILASNIFLYYNYNCFIMKYIVLFHKPLSAFIGTYEVILPLCSQIMRIPQFVTISTQKIGRKLPPKCMCGMTNSDVVVKYVYSLSYYSYVCHNK